jgi:hypothetical protein
MYGYVKLELVSVVVPGVAFVVGRSIRKNGNLPRKRAKAQDPPEKAISISSPRNRRSISHRIRLGTVR